VGALTAGVAAAAGEPYQPKGNMKQSICRWCYARTPLEKLAEEAVKIGYQSIELLNPPEVLTVKKLGLSCAVLNGGRSVTIPNCLNRVENHDAVEKDLRASIEFAAAEGVPTVICFSGNRRGLADDEGLKNCAKGLKRVVGYAEEKEVTLIMEGLNSKVNHRDYMYDTTPWGVELCKQVGSDRFKLLYDIYHMQIMEGDVIATIRKYKDYIGHYHTGGVPGRAEIDETQELNYPAIVQAIVANGFKGYLGQEFVPKREPLASLAQGFRICDV
jgi:hydroxypyruvate isomerase